MPSRRDGEVIARRIIETPVGPVVGEVSQTELGLALSGLGFSKGGQATTEAQGTDAAGVLDQVEGELAEYFAGGRRTFDIALAPRGTPFRQRVWDALLDIPFGETISYGELARRIGDPNASRAVGAANGANPIPIIIPCHRVIDSRGRLHGYGGGLERKAQLLSHEGIAIDGMSIAEPSPLFA